MRREMSIVHKSLTHLSWTLNVQAGWAEITYNLQHLAVATMIMKNVMNKLHVPLILHVTHERISSRFTSSTVNYELFNIVRESRPPSLRRSRNSSRWPILPTTSTVDGLLAPGPRNWSRFLSWVPHVSAEVERVERFTTVYICLKSVYSVFTYILEGIIAGTIIIIMNHLWFQPLVLFGNQARQNLDSYSEQVMLWTHWFVDIYCRYCRRTWNTGFDFVVSSRPMKVRLEVLASSLHAFRTSTTCRFVAVCHQQRCPETQITTMACCGQNAGTELFVVQSCIILHQWF